MKTLRWILLPLFVAMFALAGCAGQNPLAAPPTATPLPPIQPQGGKSVEGRVVPRAYANLAFSMPGQIGAIPLAEGATAEAGTVLMSLSDRAGAESRLASAKLAEVSAQQALDTLNRKADVQRTAAEEALIAARQAAVDARQKLADVDTDELQDQLDDKETAVQEAKDDLKDAEEEAEKTANLDKDNQKRKDNEDKVEEMEKALAKAQRELDTLRNELDLAKSAVARAEAAEADALTETEKRANGADPDELALANARLADAQAAVRAAESTLELMDIKAPFAGTVADLRDLQPGQWISAGFQAVTLADFSEWYVETRDLNELDVVDVAVDQKVTMTVDALPGLELRGVVTGIKPVYTERSGDVLYTVRIRLTDTSDSLRWGMTVQVEFD